MIGVKKLQGDLDVVTIDQSSTCSYELLEGSSRMKRIMGSVYEIFSDAVDVLIEITGE